MAHLFSLFCIKLVRSVSYLAFSVSFLYTPISSAQNNPLAFYPEQIEPAIYFQQQADLNAPPARQDLLIQAVISHIQDDEFDAAKSLIEILYVEPITVRQLSETKLLSAELALIDRQPQKALDILYTLPPYLPYAMMIMQNDLLAKAYAMNEETILSVEHRIALGKRLKEKNDLNYNQQQIWKTIQTLPSNQIEDIKAATSNRDLKAWLEVVTMQKNYLHQPLALEQAIETFVDSYPGHPGIEIAKLKQKLALAKTNTANNNLTDKQSIPRLPRPTFIQHDNQALMPIDYRPQGKTQIAVLLPKQGDYSSAAKAIEKGLLHAYFAEPESSRPTLQFYDSYQNARGAYQRAIQQGADFVIGPLSKDNIIDLYRGRQFPVPTLVLNELPGYSTQKYANTLFQFSLSNENEAEQVAKRAIQDGRANVLVIRTDKPWGKKLETAFANVFDQFGGSIREQVILKTGEDPTLKIRKALQYSDKPKKQIIHMPVDAHELMLESIEELGELGEELSDINDDLANTSATDSPEVNTDPQSVAKQETEDKRADDNIVEIDGEMMRVIEKMVRHRTDIDMIFLALSPMQAQQVIPLLRFFYAHDIPVYSTSIINSAPVGEHHDLEGAIFCDMPWIVSNSANAGQLRQTLHKHWPNSYTSQPRLFAFGLDAYHIIRELPKRNQNMVLGMQGYTGLLNLDTSNKVNRELPWAQFRKGKLRQLDQN